MAIAYQSSAWNNFCTFCYFCGTSREYLSTSMQPIRDYYANPIRPPEILLKVRAGTTGRRILQHLLPIPQDAPKRPRNHRHHPLRQETASPRRQVPLRGVLHRPASHRLDFFLCHTDLRSALPLATEGTQDCHTDLFLCPAEIKEIKEIILTQFCQMTVITMTALFVVITASTRGYSTNLVFKKKLICEDL